MGQAVLSTNSYFNTWTVTTDSTSVINLDIQKSTYANYPNTSSLHGSTGIFISSSTKNTGTTGYWSGSTGIAGDIMLVKLLATDNTASKVMLSIGYSTY